MSGRSKEETAGVSLLGNQNVRYPDNYAPEVLETFVNKHPGNDYFVKFNCPNLPVCVRSQDNRILRPLRFPMFRGNGWLRANP